MDLNERAERTESTHTAPSPSPALAAAAQQSTRSDSDETKRSWYQGSLFLAGGLKP